MTPIEIHAAQEPEIESLRQIFNTIVAAGQAFVHDTALDRAEFKNYLANYTGVYAATRESAVLGGYVVRPNQPGRGGHMANATYFVDERVRGKGVGRLLAEHSFDEARRLGFAAMQFNAVVASNVAAVSFWRGLGMQTIGAVPQAFRLSDGSLADLLIMHRAL